MPDGVVASTIATALVSTVLFAYSTFVMPALAARPAAAEVWQQYLVGWTAWDRGRLSRRPGRR